MTVQGRRLVILTTEGGKDLSLMETLALRHRLRRDARCTSDIPRLRGDRRLLPSNGGVSVGTTLGIALGDHKDRPYGVGAQDDRPFAP